MKAYKLVLASNSPRRRELLARAGFDFDVRPPEVDETPLPGEVPEQYARRLAREKAAAVPRSAGEIVIAADTIVVAEQQILGKPQDPADARRMLELLAGRRHEVITAFCLAGDDFWIEDLERTSVWFLPLEPAEIQEYIDSGEPMDKAGGYAVQGLASKFVERIEGCYFNVVGLPLARLYRHLRRLGASRDAKRSPSTCGP